MSIYYWYPRGGIVKSAKKKKDEDKDKVENKSRANLEQR